MFIKHGGGKHILKSLLQETYILHVHVLSSKKCDSCVVARRWCIPEATESAWRVCAWGSAPPCRSQRSWK